MRRAAVAEKSLSAGPSVSLSTRSHRSRFAQRTSPSTVSRGLRDRKMETRCVERSTPLGMSASASASCRMKESPGSWRCPGGSCRQGLFVLTGEAPGPREERSRRRPPGLRVISRRQPPGSRWRPVAAASKEPPGPLPRGSARRPQWPSGPQLGVGDPPGTWGSAPSGALETTTLAWRSTRSRIM